MLDNSELVEAKNSINETPKKNLWHCGNKECTKTHKPIPGWKGGGLPWCCSKECIKAARQQHKMEKPVKSSPPSKPRLSKDGLMSAILSSETLNGDEKLKFMAIVDQFQ